MGLSLKLSTLDALNLGETIYLHFRASSIPPLLLTLDERSEGSKKGQQPFHNKTLVRIVRRTVLIPVTRTTTAPLAPLWK
ncbi:hypothetical protein Q1695_015057 [Nippostrongylus brasiliensis]|nr:hypothetical protein Q1695_015057 [Nippostrongylus brasiliensis]